MGPSLENCGACDGSVRGRCARNRKKKPLSAAATQANETTPEDRWAIRVANCIEAGMSATEAYGCPWPKYTALFQEINYRHDPKRNDMPDAPDDAFVLSQMEYFRSQGVLVN